MNFDPLTLSLGTAIAAFIMALVLTNHARGFPPGIRGMNYWGAGCAAIFVAAMFTSLRGIIPDFFAVVLAGLAIEAGWVLVCIGLLRFNERGIPARLLGAVIMLSLMLITYFTHVEDSFQARVIFVSGTSALLFVLCMVTVLKGRPGQKLRFSEAFTAFYFFVEILISLVRVALAIWLEHPQANSLPMTGVQQFYLAEFAGYPLGIVFMSVGLILMANDRLKEELQYLASRDTLTGAFTRRAFIEMAEREQARSQRSGQPTALLMVDLDHFKAINDSHGHQMGDRVLQRFVGIAQACLRRQDILGRYGGEEFMVMLPDSSRDTALKVAERICAKVATTPVPLAQDQPIRITVSIGVAVGDHKTSLDRLIGAADEAMYRAKAAGRSRVEYADESVTAPAGIPPAAG